MRCLFKFRVPCADVRGVLAYVLCEDRGVAVLVVSVMYYNLDWIGMACLAARAG